MFGKLGFRFCQLLTGHASENPRQHFHVLTCASVRGHCGNSVILPSSWSNACAPASENVAWTRLDHEGCPDARSPELLFDPDAPGIDLAMFPSSTPPATWQKSRRGPRHEGGLRLVGVELSQGLVCALRLLSGFYAGYQGGGTMQSHVKGSEGRQGILFPSLHRTFHATNCSMGTRARITTTPG